MSYVALASGWALVWLLGVALLLALDWPRGGPDGNPGRAALRLGFGFIVGALLLTLWMRVSSALGLRFSWVALGLPLALAAAGLLALAARRGALSYAATTAAIARLWHPGLSRWQRLAWLLLLAWLVLRLALLGAEVAWQPLYPWDAWVQWATKARVWYELGRIVPFEQADVWLAGSTGAYFDAAPRVPATVPLLQVWSCVALGRWDDSAMNWPWLLTLLAMTLAIYGVLRDQGLGQLAALTSAYLVASIPLVGVHVALAGYADLLLAAAYLLAALTLYRWTRARDRRDAWLAVALAACCPLIKALGVGWALTLLAGVAVAVMPSRGVKLVAIALTVVGLGLLGTGQLGFTGSGQQFALAFQSSWSSLAQNELLFANWHLFWYAAIALVVFGGRLLVRAPLAPLSMIAAAGVGLLIVVFAYPGLVALAGDYTTVNRATLQLAPLLICLGALLWRELTAALAPPPEAAPVPAAVDA
ncbi:MAG TPA: hypothetical protein VMQ50_12395 [Casimicrobiaceae bacterium]|nr:hypothetical protein [Casimicrobiaceae bacterium]